MRLGVIVIMYGGLYANIVTIVEKKKKNLKKANTMLKEICLGPILDW